MNPKFCVSDEKILEQLQRILVSRSFEGVERLKKFLSFIVEETLAGRGGSLKEFAVGEFAFDKGANFDPRNDPIVRVQARRLRDRLTRYHQEEGQNDEVTIELPKGRYVPNFRLREVQKPVREQPPLLLTRNSVAVRPFEAHDPSPESEYLAQTLTQEISHHISAIRELTVVSVPGGRAGDGPHGHSPANVALWISGSVQRAGGKVRLTWQLLDAGSGEVLHSQSNDWPAADHGFELQEEVAVAVARVLSQGLSNSGWRRSGTPTLRNLAAHNFYTQGRYHVEQRTEESLRLAVRLFERAIAEDSRFAKAHAGLADAYELLGHYGVLSPVEVWSKAPTSANAAVLLDENNAEGHVSLAHVRATQDWDWAGSEEQFRRAIALDPHNATAHHWYAMACLCPTGRLDEALQRISLAKQLAPLSSIIARDVATVYYYRREYESALESCDQAIELNPYFYQAYWTLGFIQDERQDVVESTAAFNRALDLAPHSPRNLSALGRNHALQGRKKEALRIVEELQEMANSRYVSPYQFASIYFALEEKEKGYEWLERAFRDRCYELTLIKVDPRFDPLRADAAFITLAAQLKLP